MVTQSYTWEVAASTISPATLATPRELRRPIVLRMAGSLLDHWHLLSFDAPTVAMAWTLSFAAVFQVRLPVLGPVMLGLATWLLYVADRLLDAARPAQATALQTRHHFHQRHRILFLTVAACLLPLLAWLVVTRLDAAPLREDLVLTGCALVYLLFVHFPLGSAARTRIRLPKELIVGIIFAAACGIPTWSRVPAARPTLLLPLCLFAALCWVNCVAIEYWEGGGQKPERFAPSTLWVGRHLNAVTGIVAVFSIASLLISTRTEQGTSLPSLYLAVAISSGILAWLHRRRASLNPLRLRAAADAALLTPALLVPVCIILGHHLHIA